MFRFNVEGLYIAVQAVLALAAGYSEDKVQITLYHASILAVVIVLMIV